MKNRIINLMAFSLFSTIMLTSCIEPSKNKDSFTWDFEYNDDGLVTKTTDPGNKTTQLEYQFYAGTEKLRKIEKKTTDGKVTHSFDEWGRLIEMQDLLGRVTYRYDQVGNLASVSRDDLPSISFAYNNSDQITSVSLSNGLRIEYEYDFLDRLVKMKTPAGEIIYSYNTGDATVVRQLPNGIWTQYKYLPNGKLESIIHVNKENYIISSYAYTYNPDGLISNIIESDKHGKHTLTYEYDQVQRLIAYTDKDGSKTEYAYDEFGNRTEVKVNGTQTEIYAYDGLGRMLTRNGVECEYDHSSNLLTDNNGEETYSYNSSNKIEKAGNISYAYDGDGLLISRNSNSKKTDFINNPLSEIWQPLLASADDNNETFYIWEGNSPIASIENGKAFFFLADHLSSVRGKTDAEGNITQQINYSPFGTPDQEISNNTFMPGFTGLFYDRESQLYLTKVRAYDPNSGRFMQIDPLHQVPKGTQKDLSLFAYCGGDPINYTDQNGLQSKPINDSQIWWDAFFSSYVYGKNDKKNWPEVNYDIKNDWNYFWKTPVRDDVVKQIMDNSIQKSPDLKEASNKATYWRKNTGQYLKENPNAIRPTAAEFQVAGNSMLAKSAPLTGLLTVEWGMIHYIGERSQGVIRPSHFTTVKGENTWQRQTWKTIVYPRVESIKELMIQPISNTLSTIKNNTTQFFRQHRPQINKINNSINPFSVRNASAAEFTPSYPSNVGGVYLGGAGKAFEGLGQLSGIAIDESNGKLVLISEDQEAIDLPPLRMDDVVTVFQSVYKYGEAPSVSIDPDPEDPKGPIMNTRHGEATNDTYVGWVLFETDRIMKAYSLGEDNITKEPLKSKVPGYEEVLNTKFSGKNTKKTWERYWIVPDRQEKSMSAEKTISLFDVPLRVNTQKMVMRNGKLENDLIGKSSKGSLAFSSWFTNNYDKIAEEAYSLPPAGSGFDSPVPVFKELERIALITAIAEQLRDQGIVYPFWMRDYEVNKFPIPKTTPSHTVTRNNGNSVYTIFGGVNLSASDDRVYTKTLSPTQNKLVQQIQPILIDQPYFESVAVKVDETNYQAAVLPGSDTKDLGACTLNEIDLTVPIKGEYALTISRKFNSFIAPIDNLFASTWTLDLPILEEQKIPYNQTDYGSQYKAAYHLISPLNSYYEKVEKTYIGNHKSIGFETKMVMSPDGTNLHFNEKGYLVGYEQGPVLIRYNRDKNNNIFQIVGFYGSDALADIKLKYDAGRLLEALGSNGDRVNYVYSKGGSLTETVYSAKGENGQSASSKDVISYSYHKDLVTTIEFNGELIRQFVYNEKGQLLGESSPGNGEVAYNITTDQHGSKVSTHTRPEAQETEGEKKSFFSWLMPNGDESSGENSSGGVEEFIQYDASFRPIKEVSKDGQTVEWNYSNVEYDKMEISQSPGDKFTIKQSKDGREIDYSLSNGIEYEENYNESGKLLGLKRNNKPLYQQKWQGDMLTATEFENSRLNYDYDEEGKSIRTLITPPGENKSWHTWMEYKYDDSGNIAEIEDYTGMKSQYQYDENGDVSSISSNQGKVNIRRDKGLVNEIETSWGDKIKYNYDSNGQIRDILNISAEATSEIKFVDGQISEISDSNGSNYQFTYYTESQSNLVRQIITPVNKLDYSYNENDQLISVKCNDKYEVDYDYDDKARIKKIQISSR